MINKYLFLIVIYMLSTSLVWAGEINSVVYEENGLKIYLTEKDNYKLIPQNDPFRLNIELEKTKPGILSRKMLFHEGIISEIFSRSNERGGSIIEILFAEPTNADIELRGNFLYVKFPSDKAIVQKNQISRIIDILAKETDEGYEISIYGDSVLPEPIVSRVDNFVEISFENVKFNAELPKNIPVDVRAEGNYLIFNFLVGKNYDVKSFHLGDEVIMNFNRVKIKEVPTLSTAQKTENKSDNTKLKPTEIKRISLDFQDADIVGVLRLLGDISGYNIVIHPDVKGKITLKLSDVPWTQALDIVCKTFYLGNVFEDNIIRIAPLKVFQEEKKLLAETKDLFKKAEDTDTKIISLRYASPDKVKATVEGAKLLSPQGNIVIDERTRSLIVKDIPAYLKEIENFIKSLDKPIRQILLETRIIEISSNYSKSLGFEWGISWFPNYTSSIVGSQSGPLTVPGGSTPLAINLPASSGATGIGTTAFTIGYLNPAGTFALDLRISALQESGKGKIISNPKIITLDNQKAKIVQGESIPYGEKDVQSGQISTKFKDVAITVETTPNLIDDRSMQLSINVVKEDLVEFINIGGTFAPRTTKLEGVTKVTLKDGETLVIGGIYKKKDTIRDSKVPLLGDIPIAGEFFKSTGRDETLYEVMIFITPRILSYE